MDRILIIMQGNYGSEFGRNPNQNSQLFLNRIQKKSDQNSERILQNTQRQFCPDFGGNSDQDSEVIRTRIREKSFPDHGSDELKSIFHETCLILNMILGGVSINNIALLASRRHLTVPNRRFWCHMHLRAKRLSDILGKFYKEVYEAQKLGIQLKRQHVINIYKIP